MRPPDNDRGGPLAGPASSVISDRSDSDSSLADPHCCGVLDLESLRECARRGITCGLTQCARWELAVVGLREGRVSA